MSAKKQKPSEGRGLQMPSTKPKQDVKSRGLQFPKGKKSPRHKQGFDFSLEVHH